MAFDTPTISLICPHDKTTLRACAGHYICPHCQRRYPVVDGVVCTLDQPDAFYEGAYGNQTHFLPRSEKLWHVWPLWLINSGYVWAVRKAVPAGATVVELGCAGGVRYFGQRYRMIGCDLSWAALKSLDFYPLRLQVDAAACTALPDASVDAVVSSYFWEHIPPEIKPKILKECQRILKPDGKLVFLYDVETDNPLIRKYKNRDPGLYRKLFIEGDGHLGYQWPDENLGLFLAEGFQILEHCGLDKTWVQASSTYSKLAQFAGGSYLKPLGALGSTRWFYPWTGFMRLVDTLICPWLPERWARIDRILAIKQNNE
jgi:SAM-dependent methyltransferase